MQTSKAMKGFRKKCFYNNSPEVEGVVGRVGKDTRLSPMHGYKQMFTAWQFIQLVPRRHRRAQVGEIPADLCTVGLGETTPRLE